MKKIRVAELVWPENSMPPVGYGPIQLVAARVANGLVDKGFEVTSFTTGDSKVNGNIIPVTPKATRGDKSIPDQLLYHSVTIAEFLKRKDEFDIVHSHIGHAIITLLPVLNIPVVITLHGCYDNPHTPKVYEKYAKSAQFVAISEAQKTTLPGVQYAGTVYHGVDPDEFPYEEEVEDYMAYVGRTSPYKGIGNAIQIAIKLKKKLKIAAHIDVTEAGKSYYESDIKPYLDNPYVEFLGEVSQDEVKKLVSKAKLFLYPISFMEAFGLVVAEANVCGTPVVTFPEGAMPEIIQDGISGYIAEKGNINQMEQLVEKIYSLSKEDYLALRRSTRKRIEDNFSLKNMVDGYAKIFQRLVG